MTKQEAKEYAIKLAKESGADEATVTHISTLYDNDKFYQGFVPRPEVDRSLDAERTKYKQFQERNDYLEKQWFPEAKAAYENNKKIATKYSKYVELYGDIDPEDANAQRKAAANMGISKEELATMLNETLDSRLSARDRATLDLMEIREDYTERFKKRLPLNEFEKHVAEARKQGSNDSLQAIYKDWIAPEVEKISTTATEERIKREREEAVRDYQSRHGIPAAAKPREAHLLLDREKLEKDADKGQSGREAFLQVLNDPEPDTVKSRFPA